MSSRCNTCGRPGRGYGECPSCLTNTVWVQTHLEMVEDMRPMVSDLNSAAGECWCAICTCLCTALCSCLRWLCAGKKETAGESQPLVGSEATVADDPATQQNVAQIRRYVELYNARNLDAARAFVMEFYSPAYSSVLRSSGKVSDRDEVIAGFEKAIQNGWSRSNLKIIAASPTSVNYSTQFNTPQSSGILSGIVQFDPPGFFKRAEFYSYVALT